MCVTEVREVETENEAASDLAIGRGSDPAKGAGIEAGVTENEVEVTSAAGIEIEADREIGDGADHVIEAGGIIEREAYPRSGL